MKEILLNKLKDCKKLVIMGIGNELKGDDAIGIYVVKKLMRYFNKEGELINIKNLYLINAGTVPDFFTDILKEINPTHILIVDCAVMGKEAGAIEIKKEDIIEALKLFKENYKIDKKDIPVPVYVYLVKRNILFLNPIEGTLKPQSYLVWNAIKKLL